MKESNIKPLEQAIFCAAYTRNVLDPRINLISEVVRIGKIFLGEKQGSSLKRFSDEDVYKVTSDLGIPEKSLPDVFAELYYRDTNESDRKEKGVVFTPYWLSRHLVLKTQDHWLRLNRGGRSPKTLLDSSCGVGSFLFSSQELFGSEIRKIGYDIDPKSLTYANLLCLSIKGKWSLIEKDKLVEGVHGGDLFSENAQKYDLILANPPYVRSQSLIPSYKEGLKRLYPTYQQGNADLSVAFLEQAISILADDGIACFLVTNKILKSKYGEAICRKIATETRLIEVEDYGDLQIFPKHTTYTCAIFFAKKNKLKDFQLTRYPNGLDEKSHLTEGVTEIIPTSSLELHPWKFATGLTDHILTKVRSGLGFEKIFKGIYQGIRTGANDIFIGEGDDFLSEIDKESLISFVDVDNIGEIQITGDVKYLIYPYIFDGNHVVPMSNEAIQGNFPKTYAYLLKNKSKLQQRSMDEKSSWFLYSRSQNLDLSYRPKILVKEMMPEAAFTADIEGCYAFSSGYAIDISNMSKNDGLIWTSVLSTPVMEFVLRHFGTQLHSGWFRLMKHHLESIRLPKLSEDCKNAILTSLKKKDKDIIKGDINRLVAQAYGLSVEELNYIREYLEDCHLRSMPKKAAINKFSNVSEKYEPVKLSKFDKLHIDKGGWRQLVTFQGNKKTPIHSWYRYTQGYSKELVETLLHELGAKSGHKVLDPFSGCGTTGLVCGQLGINFIGVEISPLMVWVSGVKTASLGLDLRQLLQDIKSFSPPRTGKSKRIKNKLFGTFLGKAFSENISSQIELMLDYVEASFTGKTKDFFTLAIISSLENLSTIRKHGSHYRFLLDSENVGVGKLNIKVTDQSSDIRPIILEKLNSMFNDLELQVKKKDDIHPIYILGDARKINIEDKSVDLVITSPPYLNRNNYISQQKAELSFLDLVHSEEQYKSLVQSTIRSHTDADLKNIEVSISPYVDKLIANMEFNEGNNKSIKKMIVGYFNDLDKTLEEMHRVLKKDGKCAFVVGNTRWGGVVVPVDHLLANFAELRGFRVKSIFVTRMKGNSPQQMKQFGRIPVRESVVIFEKT